MERPRSAGPGRLRHRLKVHNEQAAMDHGGRRARTGGGAPITTPLCAGAIGVTGHGPAIERADG